MARNTSGLRRGSAPGLSRLHGGPLVDLLPPEAAPTPVYDPEALAQQVSSEGGPRLVQGKNLFSPSGQFIRELPEGEWYVTTPEMEANNRKARAKQRAQRAGKGLVDLAKLPDDVLKIQKERAQILAAEALGE
jgi:hypothetical protein